MFKELSKASATLIEHRLSSAALLLVHTPDAGGPSYGPISVDGLTVLAVRVPHGCVPTTPGIPTGTHFQQASLGRRQALAGDS